ncbi:MAG: Bacterial export protein family 3 [Pseudomonadota bacterium]|jgi:type III secretory pathway component EscS
MFEELVEQYARYILVCTAWPLGIGAACGLMIGVLQAATQIQEQGIIYLVKLIAVTTVLWLGSDYFLEEGLDLLARTIGAIGLLGG